MLHGTITDVIDAGPARCGDSLVRVTRGPALLPLADRHSCLAAPYAPTDPRTARYFELVISKAEAPVVCGFAGKLKGKAIYAAEDLPRNARIWTESPYLGMQHELNKRTVACCQYCFLPLLADSQARWREMVARWNHAHRHDPALLARAEDLDCVLARLGVDHRSCGLVGPATTCACGDRYCSKLCQIRAYHEFHAILCPRADAFSAMSEFIRHTQQTNDIFLLAAKVIARVLSRFLVTQDLVKAREPMDMFYKKPWWEVVMMEKHIQQRSHRTSPAPPPPTTTMEISPSMLDTVAEDDGLDGEDDDRDNEGNDQLNHLGHHRRRDSLHESSDHVGPNRKAPRHHRHSNRRSHITSTAPVDHDANGVDADRPNGSGPSVIDATAPGQHDDNGESRCLKDLLVSTHQLLLDALESNLVHLEREDQLQGHTVDEIWTTCASILSFEFFAAQLGLFEMNNIRVEIDHPFHALMEVLDRDSTAAGNESPTDEGDRELFDRVRGVLALGEEDAIRQQIEALERDGMAPEDVDALLESGGSGALRGFPEIDGTALFPIICTMNHSCDPNCTVLYAKNGDAHVVAVRDIPKGEELCICYIDIDEDVLERDARLREYRFRCLCPRCTHERRHLREATPVPPGPYRGPQAHEPAEGVVGARGQVWPAVSELRGASRRPDAVEHREHTDGHDSRDHRRHN